MAPIHMSLRRYILAALLVLATLVISLLSVLWTNSFFTGLDDMMKGTMLNVAQAHHPQPGQPVKAHNFVVASQWQDLPDAIRTAFSRQDIESNALHKNVTRDNILTRPSDARFVMYFEKPDGQSGFVAHHFIAPKTPPKAWFQGPEILGILFALGTLALFASILVMLMRTVTRPVAELHAWAAELDHHSLNEPPPVFRYHELTTLAELIQQSLQQVKQSLDREQAFVSYASHELRTPIAVIRSSVELLQRLDSAQCEKSNKALKRIDHASQAMVALTETLLWLSRKGQPLRDLKTVKLAGLVESLMQDLTYLKQGKHIDIRLETDDYRCELPHSGATIVIGNLLRNAIQHTHQGAISIHQTQHILEIENHEYIGSEPPSEHSALHNTAGYGLGLDLAQKLCDELGWQLSIRHDAHRFCVTLVLSPQY
ncbi:MULTISPECIES: HAMP domain-containing sensor histidine kinase [unclassified Pseudoalteromonas]|uniref:sensor histidine kinase n=1 Tax=unclassified Pseudoalteromonas TaxID=194690 RepID=UPI002096B727|nr:HAMP domain-containing sensor histidine kinase [Pseudoalteromonas sp. XMcav2-N]MCO7191303.1 HAMP domain-containing histidine kinase [Pseudoalteromonas sp. XMcav2-N]